MHATAAPEYGRGALIGLAAGADAATIAVLAALIESLMARGMVVPTDIAARWRHLGVAPLTLVAVPIGLFHGGQDDELTAGVLAVGDMLRADVREVLSAVAVARAISAGTFELGHAQDMALAAVDGIDEAAKRLALSSPPSEVTAAHEALRDDLRAAVGDAEPNEGALRIAFWHLLHDGDASNAGRDALTGALLGAQHGAAALAPELAEKAAPLLGLIAGA